VVAEMNVDVASDDGGIAHKLRLRWSRDIRDLPYYFP
jgi:hypothetical protein